MKTKQLGLHTSLNQCLGMVIGGFIEIRIGRCDTAPEEMTMHREAAETHRAQGQEMFWIGDQHRSLARLPEAKTQR
jgi:hypothetical protein